MKKKEERAWLKRLEEEFPCLIIENQGQEQGTSSSHFDDIEISFDEELIENDYFEEDEQEQENYFFNEEELISSYL